MSFWGPPIFKGCMYPVLNALIAGGLGYALGYVIGTVAMAERPDMTGWSVALVAAVLIWTVDHFWWMSIQERAWMRALEASKPQQDDQVNVPDPATLRVLVTSEDKRRGEYIDLPANDKQLFEFASGVLAGKPATYRIWTRDGGPFSEAEFSRLSARMVDRGLAERGRNGTIELTPAGRHVMTGVVEGKLSPSGRQNILEDDWKLFDTTRHDGENAVGEG
jgi:hypothetical protein